MSSRTAVESKSNRSCNRRLIVREDERIDSVGVRKQDTATMRWFNAVLGICEQIPVRRVHDAWSTAQPGR